jgi:hypothetical protein
MALWILPKRGLLCVGAKANVPLCGGKKLNKKMCGGEKKKYRRVGKVCRLSSCPFVIWSVCLCLSVKMVYASLVCLTVTVRVARSNVFTLAANANFCQTAVISCPSVRPKCCRSCLQGLSAMNGCGCLHSLLLLLRLPVSGGKSKCECKCVGFVCCVVKIVGFIVQLQFYFQTSSNSNLSKLRLMLLPRLRQ